MKKLNLVILFLAITCISYAQTNTFPSSGNVGIGTTNPSSNLQVGDVSSIATSAPNTISLGGTFSSTHGANPKLKIYDNGTNFWGLGISSYQLDYIVDSRSYDHAFYAGGNELIRIKGNGNVGIGTTSPASSLEVAGDPTIYAGIAYQSTIQSRDIRAFAAGVGGGIIFAGNYTALPNNTAFAGIAGVKENGTSGDYAGALIFSTRVNGASPGERMRISSSGNVGIGTTNPGNYKLAVNGGIHSQSVNVDLTGWSDYVFNKEYHLRSLADIKTYIDQNHHLPDMPSEREVVKDGINLGEMNKLLTKKVEELTLYLIDKDNKINSLEKALGDQQKNADVQITVNQRLQEEIDELKQQLLSIKQPK